MIIHTKIPKSKKRKVPKAVKLQYETWLKSLELKYPNRNIAVSTTISNKVPSPKIPPGRETPKYPSIDTGIGSCTKKFQNVYTGDKLKGIATMHKSNAVPVFTDNEAKEISSMRR